MSLEEDKRDAFITVIHGWIRRSKYRGRIRFNEFQSIMAKVCHAYTAIPTEKGLLSPCNRMIDEPTRSF